MIDKSNAKIVEIAEVLSEVDSSLSKSKSTRRIARDVDNYLRFFLLFASGFAFIVFCYLTYATWQRSQNNEVVNILTVFVIFVLGITSTILSYGYTICKRINLRMKKLKK